MIIVGIIIVCYCFLMVRFLIGFDRVSELQFSNTKSAVSFSVIVPFRNESDRLPGLLTSIKNLDYPAANVEFIFVDDESTDTSVDVITQFIEDCEEDAIKLNIRILNNRRTSSSPKKDAIQTAIQQSNHEWILTTDADCLLPKNWLQCYSKYIQEHDVFMVAGPVSYTKESSLLNTIQYVEFHTLQAVTIGSFGMQNAMMCNGANLAYTKSAFQSVDGFEGNDSIASGDDVFLFEKMYAMDRKKVHFLKSKAALVRTFAQKTWRQFIAQRIRWTSKSTHYKRLFTKEVGILVFITNLSLVISIFLTIFGYFSWLFFLTVFILKISFDLVVYLKFDRFFIQHKLSNMLMLLLTGILYPFVSVLVVLLSAFSGYSWKGRRFSS